MRSVNLRVCESRDPRVTGVADLREGRPQIWNRMRFRFSVLLPVHKVKPRSIVS